MGQEVASRAVAEVVTGSDYAKVERKLPIKVAILGWGSLLWDPSPDFDERLEAWQTDGPILPLEFSRVSETRGKALTLVVDEKNGSQCQVAYAMTKRKSPEDAVADLRCREGTVLAKIGCFFSDGSRKAQSHSEQTLAAISVWAKAKSLDVVVWTDLSSNFPRKSIKKKEFTVPNAIEHLQSLGASGKARAAEYVWRAPDFVTTPLRSALQAEPWFLGNKQSDISGARQ